MSKYTKSQINHIIGRCNDLRREVDDLLPKVEQPTDADIKSEIAAGVATYTKNLSYSGIPHYVVTLPCIKKYEADCEKRGKKIEALREKLSKEIDKIEDCLILEGTTFKLDDALARLRALVK